MDLYYDISKKRGKFMKSLISIVAPAYNEEDVIEKFYLRITKILSALSEYNYEICIVND